VLGWRVSCHFTTDKNEGWIEVINKELVIPKPKEDQEDFIIIKTTGWINRAEIVKAGERYYVNNSSYLFSKSDFHHDYYLEGFI